MIFKAAEVPNFVGRYSISFSVTITASQPFYVL